MDIIDNREVYCEQWTDYEESKRDRLLNSFYQNLN